MVRYKMLGMDVNSSPTQYRTWVVEDQPDFTGNLYTGLKSGSNPLINIEAYIIYDDTVVADFNLPIPTTWNTTKKVLPDSVANSQLAIIDGYAYLFGGKISSRIYRANLNNPADWVDTGAQLPNPLYGSQLIIIGDTIYLFGGNDGSATDHIFSAPTSDPLTWTDHGSRLPDRIYNAQLFIVNGNLYLLGGYNATDAINTIFTSSFDDPLNWYNTGNTLPNNLYGSQVAIIGDYVYLLGGLLSVDIAVNHIYSAPLINPIDWAIVGSLPYAACNGQFFTVGNKGYLITPGVVSTIPKSAGTRILSCDLESPTQWIDTLKMVPGEVSESQVAIIDDRIFLFGGSGSSVIFANSSELKYNFDTPSVVSYGFVTRTQYNNTSNKLDLFKVLGFPPWKTSYGA